MESGVSPKTAKTTSKTSIKQFLERGLSAQKRSYSLGYNRQIVTRDILGGAVGYDARPINKRRTSKSTSMEVQVSKRVGRRQIVTGLPQLQKRSEGTKL